MPVYAGRSRLDCKRAANFRKFQSVTGVEDAIKRLMKENQGITLEISVLVSDKLMGRKVPEVHKTSSNFQILCYPSIFGGEIC
jgi:hypothetical protein